MPYATRRDWQRFRVVVIAAGLAASILFVLAGVATRLQMYGDGSIFSYAVAAQDAWAFHWHNLSGRFFTYVYAYMVPEQIVALTGSARAGIAVYGVLFFSAPLLGLLITAAADRSRERIVFTYACASTVLLCPFVFGAPTEMWVAHAVFWPALAVSLSAPANVRGAIVVCLALLALVFTHEGAVVLAASMLAALLCRGWRNPVFVRACAACALAILVWAAVKLTIRPDDYIAAVLAAAAFRFIDLHNLAQPMVLTLCTALAGYSVVLLLLHAASIERAHVYSSLVCVAALALFWARFDHWLLAEARYDLRTVLLIGIPVLGLVAALETMTADDWQRSPLQSVGPWFLKARALADPRALAGAFAFVLLMHAVESGKFVSGWLDYKAAVRALASGSVSNPELGSPLFVSSQHIGADLSRLAWNSTTPFLSVLVAPDFKPARLVVDPTAGYFWLSCKTAEQSEIESRALPDEARGLIRLHACLHRPN